MKQNKRNGALWRILTTYLRDQRGSVVLLLLLVMAGLALELAGPQILRRFVDGVSEGSTLQPLFVLAGWYAAVAALNQFVKILLAWLGQRVSWQATNAMRADLALHCLQLDMSFHKKHTPGTLIERVDGDVNQLGTFFSDFLLAMISNVLLLLGIVVVLWFEGWPFGLAVTVLVVLSALYLGKIQPISEEMWRRNRVASADYYGFLEERIDGMEEIRPNGGVSHSQHKLQHGLHQLFTTTRNGLASSAAMNVTPNMFVGLGMAAMFGIAGYMTQPSFSLGTVYVVYSYLHIVSELAWRFVHSFGQLQIGQASVKRVDEILQTPSRLHDDGTATIPSGTPSLKFDRVNFTYEPDEPHVLSDVTFGLEPGEVLGIIGRTGSGKTTIGRLLFRLYDVTDGAILINGTSVRDVPLAHLRSHIGLVTQDVQLFNATLRDNLTFFDAAVEDEQLTSALTSLGLGDWLRSLPDGLGTMIEAGGKGVSAGQAQLIAFARVFLHDPSIVILDEASSRLDPATEAWLEQAVDRLLANRTAIVIAHRLNTVRRADKILVLEQGTVVEFGDEQSLANQTTSRYAHLLHVGSLEAV